MRLPIMPKAMNPNFYFCGFAADQLWLHAISAFNLCDLMIGKIKIVCFDDEKDTLAGIKDGAIFGTVAQQPFEYGYQAVQMTAKILRGDRSVIPANKIIVVPTVVIQRKDVEEYSKKLDQLLGSK